jgi:hypothetical protein
MYKNVYFRIESHYMRSDENRPAFYEEIQNLFMEAGWEIKERYSSGSCPDAIKGKNRLYIHPQSASGPVEEELITVVEGLLSKGTTFKHYHTDVYETLYDLTDEEYMARLEQKKEQIEADLLKALRTKRKNLLITGTWDVFSGLSGKHRIPRLSAYGKSWDIEFRFTQELFQKLLDNHKIVTANTKHGIGYRAA